jgi:protein-L-isoaspartate O-methyltransferase
MATEHQPLPIVPQLTDDALDAYSLRLLRMRTPQQPVDSVLREMESLAERENVPIIGPLEGAIIQMLVSLREQPPRLVLDIGSAIGYSAIWLARGLPISRADSLSPEGMIVVSHSGAAFSPGFAAIPASSKN